MSPSIDTRENRALAAEIKFVIPLDLAAAVRLWARQHLAADPNAEGGVGDTYRITSLYFDTGSFDVFHRRGSFGRSKYRIRRYGDGTAMFLERKLKTRGVVSKRRTSIDEDQLPRLAGMDVSRDWSGAWYHRRILARNLHPVCQISYDRTARVTMTAAGPIRLTADERVCALPVSQIAFEPAGTAVPLSPDAAIIELKYRSELPQFFKQMVGEFGLRAQPVSKYRLAATRLGLVAPETLSDPVTRPAESIELAGC